jgi:hypothetical protein
MMVPTYRVSHLAAYARWKQQEENGLAWLHRAIFSTESTEAQTRGTAFHAALEKACEGEYSTVEAMGYTFAFTCEAEITLPKTREIRRSKDYDGIIVSGQCDGIEGKRIIDHKTVQQFDAEYHLAGWQHKFYLDLFEADRFDWHIWEVGELKPPPPGDVANDGGASRVYEVYAHHLLTQYRYPALEEDCRRLAQEFLQFTQRVGWNRAAA